MEIVCFYIINQKPLFSAFHWYQVCSLGPSFDPERAINISKPYPSYQLQFLLAPLTPHHISISRPPPHAKNIWTFSSRVESNVRMVLTLGTVGGRSCVLTTQHHLRQQFFGCKEGWFPMIFPPPPSTFWCRCSEQTLTKCCASNKSRGGCSIGATLVTAFAVAKMTTKNSTAHQRCAMPLNSK